MRTRILAVCIAALLSPMLMAGQETASPLARHYREGEKLVYRMKAVNEQWRYTIVADATIKRDPNGKYFEELRWTNMESNGQPVLLRADMTDFRQRLTLDPDVNPNVPELTKLDPQLIGPITDMMTFYADLWLANKVGQLKKAGDHFYFRNPMPPASWADGTRVLVGESAIDFDMRLKDLNAADGTAVLEVRHVPPENPGIRLSAEWMKPSVGSKANNWVGVTKTKDGSYLAAVGEETFTVRITVSTADGEILSATMDNRVKTIERTCQDAALTKCGEAKPHEITRSIEVALEK